MAERERKEGVKGDYGFLSLHYQGFFSFRFCRWKWWRWVGGDEDGRGDVVVDVEGRRKMKFIIILIVLFNKSNKY